MDLIFSSNGSYSSGVEHFFYELKDKFPAVKRIHGLDNESKILNLSANMADSEYFTVIFGTSDSNFLEKSFSKKFVQKNIKLGSEELNENKIETVYLTYKELQVEEKFVSMLKKWPDLKRLHGIKGLTRAFRLSADVVSSRYFVLIDGDNKLKDDFDIKAVKSPQAPNTLLFYMTQNPVNDLIYGYGGLKICPTANFRQIIDDKLDPIASGGIKEIQPILQVASITEFNTSPFNAWKAGFRESVMLTSPDPEVEMPEDERKRKLEVWKTKGKDRRFGEYAMAGAVSGERYGTENFGLLIELQKINDPIWLETLFNQASKNTGNFGISLECLKS